MTSSNDGLAHRAGLAGAATLTSRVLGLVRDQVLAALFGASNEMDAFIVAFRIPNLARDLFAEGAMSAAFVPTFTRELTLKGKRDAWRLSNSLLTALAVVTGILVLLGFLFVRPLVTAYAGNYGTVPGKLELTIQLTKIMLPFLTLAAIAAALMGMLNSLHYYFVPALAPAMFNVATIACALLLVPLMPSTGLPRISAIAIGAMIGGLGQVALQWPPLAREGFRLRPSLDFRDPGLQRVLILMGPGTLGLAATQVNVFVNTLLATSQGTGAVSWLTYAFRLIYLPIGLFGVSIATVVLPAASRHAAIDDEAAIRTTVSRSLTLMLMLNIPATIGLVVLATPIVRLLFERGRFLPSDTVATAAALKLYAVGLVGYSAARIVSPVFYAIGQSRVPVAASLVSIAFNIGVSVALAKVMGFRGLALGTSIAAMINGAILFLMLRRRLHGLEGRTLVAKTAKIVVATAAMAVVVIATERLAAGVAPGAALLQQTARLATAIVCGLATLVVTAKALRISELDEMLDGLRQVRKLL